MGFEEDRVELQGSALDRLLFDLTEGHRVSGIYVKGESNNYVGVSAIPPEGITYIEAMPGGEVRKYANDGSGNYSRLM